MKSNESHNNPTAVGKFNCLRRKADRDQIMAAKYRGSIAIHAGKKDPRTWLHPCSDYDFACVAENAPKGALFYELPRGAVIAIADLVDCVQVSGRGIEK